MAVRDDFTAGEVLAAADLNDTFASKPPFAYGTATPSTTVEGFIWYDENDTPPAPKFWDGSAFETFGGGKVLQVVRATDATGRSTTSASYVDANLSVTITPTKSTSAIILWAVFGSGTSGNTARIDSQFQITDSSNNAISGAENRRTGIANTTGIYLAQSLVGYATPATTSAVTYKLRYRLQEAGGTNLLEMRNAEGAAQLFAIEVAA